MPLRLPLFPFRLTGGGWVRRLRSLVLAGAVVAVLAGCSATNYYWQSVSGHLQLMRAARPIDEWLADAATPMPLKERLALAQRIRSFAATELALPDNPSYRRYADLQRRSVVWNVVAAPEFSLTLRTWCFPVLGCVGYRGYFDEAEARAEASSIRAEGLEVSVYGVPAYSTLGWMNWAGGDPLLSTFIQYPEGELARIIFHELAHQVVYVQDDTMFNESFATAVERLGSTRWLAVSGTAASGDFLAFDQRRRQFRALTIATKERLAEVYRAPKATEAERQELRQRKAAVMQDFRDRYDRLRQEWGGYAGYDQWVAGANNATFGAQAAYDGLVPEFEALFEREGGNWPAFYDAVKRMAALPAAQRMQALRQARSTTQREMHGG